MASTTGAQRSASQSAFLPVENVPREVLGRFPMGILIGAARDHARTHAELVPGQQMVLDAGAHDPIHLHAPRLELGLGRVVGAPDAEQGYAQKDGGQQRQEQLARKAHSVAFATSGAGRTRPETTVETAARGPSAMADPRARIRHGVVMRRWCMLCCPRRYTSSIPDLLHELFSTGKSISTSYF
jgi:hypothetical protein